MFEFPEGPKVKLDNFLEKLDSPKIRVCCLGNLLLGIHKHGGLTFAESARKTGFCETSYKNFVKGKRPCPVNFLIKFLKEFSRNDLLEKIPEMNVSFTARRVQVTLPAFLTPKLAYYIGYLQGDGCLSSDGEYLMFFDEYKEQIEFLSCLTFELFGLKPEVKSGMNLLSLKEFYRLRICSLVLNTYFNCFFGVPKGVKNRLKIPAIIKESNALLRFYLAGLFDSDGTLPKNPSTVKQFFIDVTFKDKLFIEEVRSALEVLKVFTLNPYCRKARKPGSEGISLTWELRIRKKEQIKRFLDTVSFIHPNKQERAVKLRALLGP